MNILVIITGKVVGIQKLYEHKDRGGRTALIPTYRSFIELDTGTARHEFAVTRDTSPVLFGCGATHYGYGGECPPSRLCAPYRGVIHPYRGNGLALRLSETQSSSTRLLLGIGTVWRKNILIHQGPGRSLGCMMVAGDALDFARCMNHLLRLLEDHPTSDILVHVEPRHFGDDNPLAC